MSPRHRSRVLPAFAALVLVPGSVLALGQVPAAASPAAEPAAPPPSVVPDGASAATSAGLLGLTVADVGLPAPLPSIRAARVDVAPTRGTFGAAAPRARATASNLGADAAGIDLSGLLSQAQQTAPPDNPAPATGPQVAAIPAPPIISAGLSSSSAHARLAADGACPAPGTPLTTSTVSTADVSVLDLGAVGSLLRAPGTVSTTQSVHLAEAPGAAGARAVTSTATTNLAALTLFDDVTLGISQAPVLTATASGRAGGAAVTYSQPVVTVTAPGVPGSPFVLDAANETARFALPDNPLLQLELSLGALTRTVATDGTSASGSAALLHIDLDLLPVLGDAVDIAAVDVAPLSASAGAPAGGITCSPVSADTDGDGLADDREAALGTDPTDPDTDGDGLRDGAEVDTYATDPRNPDTDGGGVRDGAEVARGTDPTRAADDNAPAGADPDGDGLTTAQEAQLGTDPTRADSDRDGLKDGAEVAGFRVRERFEVCGRKARSWIKVTTDPTSKDTDRDGLGDKAEVRGYRIKQRVVLRGGKVMVIGLTRTDPTKKDTDRDGLSDRQEKSGSANKRFGKHRTDPSKCDTDHGGVSDGREVRYRSDPANYASGPRSRDAHRMLGPREDLGGVG